MANSLAEPIGVSHVTNSQSSATRSSCKFASGLTRSKSVRGVSSGEQGSSLFEKPKVSWDCAKARTVMGIGESHSPASARRRTEYRASIRLSPLPSGPSADPMISLHEARRIITESLSPLPALDLPLAEALGSVLAAPVLADAWYPSGDRATMDGYVIRAGQEPGEFTVVGELQAGAIPEQPLGEGEAIRIFTGALVPEGGGMVIPQEMTERSGKSVKIPIFPELRFIRAKGSEAQPGAIILPDRTRLGPAELAMLAQVGAVSPSVVRKPLVRHVATGGEIVPPDQTPPEGKIRDTNTSLLHALLSQQGIESISSSRCADDPAALAELCGQACDLLLISGGASVGDYDFGAEALRRAGFTIHFNKVNLRPGKPLTFATKGSQAAFVIPGNPVSHFVCFHVAIRLALELMSGITPAWSFLDLPLGDGAVLKPDPRETYWPARAEVSEAALIVSPLRWSTSGDTFSLAGTNALLQVNETSPSGSRVKTLLLAAPF